jgi:hypothetical protein
MKPSGILDMRKRNVAAVAEDAANLARFVIVVDMPPSRLLTANRADPALVGEHLFNIGGAKAVARPEVVLQSLLWSDLAIAMFTGVSVEAILAPRMTTSHATRLPMERAKRLHLIAMATSLGFDVEEVAHHASPRVRFSAASRRFR